MGLLQKIFGEKPLNVKTNEYFKTLTAYQPVFNSFGGSLYEMELVRSAIHTHATFSSKLKPNIEGSAYQELKNILEYKPNPYMDTYKFIYRIRTILEMENTAFIVPLINDKNGYINGYYPILPSRCEIVEYNGIEYLRYTFSNGQKACVEFRKVGIMNKFQYQSDFFGENNFALNPTVNLIQTTNQGIEESIKNSATIRFMGRLANTYKAEDIESQRKNFREENLRAENNGGIVLVDNRYSELKQIQSTPYTVDSKQMELIQNNVFNYFNINEKIIQNSYNEDEWNAYYEGSIEPFAIQLSIVLTNMTFSSREIANGNRIIFTSNRLQYASNKTKLEIVTQLFDRGFLTHNQGLEIFNMPSIEDGDKNYIRKEYAEVSELGKEVNESDN